MAGIGHNNPPQTRRKSFGARWQEAVWSHPDVTPFAFCVAWMVHKFMDKNGEGVAISNKQIQDTTGMSESSAKRGKKWLSDNGFILILSVGKKVGRQTGVKTRIRALIPVNTWSSQTQVTENQALTDPGNVVPLDPGQQKVGLTDPDSLGLTDPLIREEYSKDILGSGDNNHQCAREENFPAAHAALKDEEKTIAHWLWNSTLEGQHGDKSGPKSQQFEQARDYLKTNFELYGLELIKQAVSTTKIKYQTRNIRGNPMNYLMRLLAGYKQDQRKAQQEAREPKQEFKRKLDAIV